MWELESTWPTFMLQDPVAHRLFGRVPELFPDLQLIVLGQAGEVLGRIMAVPFQCDGDLPARGWDAALEAGVVLPGEAPPAVSLLEARIAPRHQGRGLSQTLLVAMRDHLRRLGVRDLFGPVRPSVKAQEPATPMSDYVARRRPDGLPWDPWLRVHARLGGVLKTICPISMTIPGTVAQWRSWTGLPLDTSGAVEVPDALVPIHVSLEQDHCVYVEPNIWVHHRLEP
jgi:GNAT superfamily N-acetyltransferase